MMMDDKTFDSMMDGINLDFFWHELRKDPEAKGYYPSTTARRNIFMFYIRHIRANEPPLRKLSPEGEKTLATIREAMAHHADGLIPARHILYLCSGLASIAAKHTPACFRNLMCPSMEIFYEQPKPIPAPIPAPIPKPTPNRLQELRERAERKADRNFDELMREEDVAKAVRKKKKCKRKSRSQRRKPPIYEPDVDGGEELVINCPPPPAYTPN
jgi:hypothetical protein